MRAALALLLLAVVHKSFSQQVENRGCPTNYFRNNGNGQAVSVFAANISASGVYFQSALTSGNQGNFTFKWNTPVVHPPVINRTWVTSTSGVTTQNWVFGNNAAGSPFNPPGVPVDGEVKYTFYNYNLPTAGVVTLELIDPADGSYVNTCSYPLSSGSSSSGALTSLAVAAPSNLKYSLNSATVLHGIGGTSVQPSVNAAGGTAIYSLEPQVSGVAINASTGVISWSNSVAGGAYNFTVKASNGIQPDATTSYSLTVTETGVGSGGDGGLESKSLGNAVAERVFNNVVQNVPAEINYRLRPLFTGSSTARLSSLSIHDLMPNPQSLGNGFTGYETSPTDILSFTNAADVIAVDYVEAGLNKAVAFCTKTYKGIYTHTKPVCDRLKGSELIAVDTVVRGPYSFLRYRLQPAHGLVEYAVSFSAGFNQNDDRYTLQSEWTTDRYAAQDTMYNFQLWSADPVLLNKMLADVLEKLNTDMPVMQSGLVRKPVTYITRAERDAGNQLNLQLTIRNNSGNASGIIVVSGKANEQTSTVADCSYPISLQPNGTSTVTIPLKDMAEAEISLLVNGVSEDFVYNNDGTWNIFKTAATQVSAFTISNDTLQPTAGEYRLFRNVELRATTPDYVTVYRVVKGGGMAADLSAYNYLKFAASGTGKVRIRLVKKSIRNFSEQYEYVLPLQKEEKAYSINLSAFRSAGSNATLKANDILVVSFTYEAMGAVTTINATLGNVRFGKWGMEESADMATMQAYPNPAGSWVNLAFRSAVAETVSLRLTSATGGQVLMQKLTGVAQGFNVIRLRLPQYIPAGVYVVNLQSASQRFQVKIIKSN